MLLAAFFWSSALIGNKALLAYLAVNQVVAVRFGLAALVLWSVVLAGGHWRYLRKAGLRPVLMGLIEPGLVSMLFIWGQSYTSAAHATAFWALMPILMPVLGRLVLQEKLRPIDLTAGAIAAGGIFLLVIETEGADSSWTGDLLCIAGVLCACTNQLLGRRVAQSAIPPALTTAIQLLAGTTLAGLTLFATGAANTIFLHLAPPQYLLMLYLGICASAAPFFLYNFALRHMPVGRISLFPSLVTPFGTAMAIAFLGEKITPQFLFATGVILFAVFLPSLFKAIKSSPRPTELG